MLNIAATFEANTYCVLCECVKDQGLKPKFGPSSVFNFSVISILLIQLNLILGLMVYIGLAPLLSVYTVKVVFSVFQVFHRVSVSACVWLAAQKNRVVTAPKPAEYHHLLFSDAKRVLTLNFDLDL